MNPLEIARLLEVLGRIADSLSKRQQYTITGADDWQILVVIGGLLVAAIGVMWADLRSTIKEHRGEWYSELQRHNAENTKDIDLVWNAMRDCKADCCPARKKERD